MHRELHIRSQSVLAEVRVVLIRLTSPGTASAATIWWEGEGKSNPHVVYAVVIIISTIHPRENKPLFVSERFSDRRGKANQTTSWNNFQVLLTSSCVTLFHKSDQVTIHLIYTFTKKQTYEKKNPIITESPPNKKTHNTYNHTAHLYFAPHAITIIIVITLTYLYARIWRGMKQKTHNGPYNFCLRRHLWKRHLPQLEEGTRGTNSPLGSRTTAHLVCLARMARSARTNHYMINIYISATKEKKKKLDTSNNEYNGVTSQHQNLDAGRGGSSRRKDQQEHTTLCNNTHGLKSWDTHGTGETGGLLFQSRVQGSSLVVTDATS